MSSGQQPLGAEHPINRGGANRPPQRTEEERLTAISPDTIPAAEATGLGNPKGPAKLAADAGGAPDLARRSAADVLGPGALQRASVQKVKMHGGMGEGGPHMRAPDAEAAEAEVGTGKGVGGILKKAWHEVKEMTPGTDEHKEEFGTRWTTGTYATTFGKRSNPGVGGA